MKKMLVEGFPNYFILETGVVWSIKRNKEVKSHTHKSGYIHISLSKDGKRKSFKLHRLLAIHFIPNPDNKPTIDHINHIKTDNRLKNLRWATMKEQSENKGVYKNNKAGHKGIHFNKDSQKWVYSKRGKYLIYKRCKSKIDALCLKFYWLLKINVSQKRLRNFQLQ